MAHFLVGEHLMRDDNVSRARRHFFHVVSALACAVVLTAVSKAAAQIRPGRPPTPPRGGHCILRGTRILTSRGAERIESLSIGDLVMTTRGEMPIKWVGRQHFSQGRSARWPDSVHPIRISRSALADNVPRTDL